MSARHEVDTDGGGEGWLDRRRGVVGAGNDPWKLCSTYLNARNIAAEFANRDLARKLGEIFGDPDP